VRVLAAVAAFAASQVPGTLPAARAQSAATTAVPPVEYRLVGAKALYPSKIWDDGHYTYIEWPTNAELPAVFSRGSDGAEVIAEGVMMGDDYVLDRVHTLLIFRIDRQVATASRRVKRHE